MIANTKNFLFFLIGAAGLAAAIVSSGCKHTPPPKYSYSDYKPSASHHASQLQTTTLTNTIDPTWMHTPTNLFTLGPGDRVEIELLGDPGSRMSTIVGPDGKIYFNL